MNTFVIPANLRLCSQRRITAGSTHFPCRSILSLDQVALTTLPRLYYFRGKNKGAVIILARDFTYEVFEAFCQSFYLFYSMAAFLAHFLGIAARGEHISPIDKQVKYISCKSHVRLALQIVQFDETQHELEAPGYVMTHVDSHSCLRPDAKSLKCICCRTYLKIISRRPSYSRHTLLKLSLVYVAVCTITKCVFFYRLLVERGELKQSGVRESEVCVDVWIAVEEGVIVDCTVSRLYASKDLLLVRRRSCNTYIYSYIFVDSHTKTTEQGSGLCVINSLCLCVHEHVCNISVKRLSSKSHTFSVLPLVFSNGTPRGSSECCCVQ